MKIEKIKTIEEADEIISKIIDKFTEKAKKKIPNITEITIKVNYTIID